MIDHKPFEFQMGYSPPDGDSPKLPDDDSGKPASPGQPDEAGQHECPVDLERLGASYRQVLLVLSVLDRHQLACEASALLLSGICGLLACRLDVDDIRRFVGACVPDESDLIELGKQLDQLDAAEAAKRTPSDK